MLRFVNARNDKKRLNEIKSLYDEAFPKEEQIPFWILRKAGRTSTADLMQVYDLSIWFILRMWSICIILQSSRMKEVRGMEAESCRHYAAGFRHAGSF